MFIFLFLFIYLFFLFCILLTIARRLRAERPYLLAMLSRAIGRTVTVVTARCVKAATLQAWRGCAVIFGLLKVSCDNFFLNVVKCLFLINSMNTYMELLQAKHLLLFMWNF